MTRHALFRGCVTALLLFGPARAARTDGDPKFPVELTRFIPYKHNPVFTGGGKGQWDERIRERGWIMRDGAGYKMWYTAYTGAPGAILKLGYATSDDGIVWTRFPGNPIYDKHWVEDMMVIKHAGKYYMFAEGKDDRAQLLISEDGIAWTRQGQLDIRRKNGEPIPDGPYGTPTAWLEDGIWHLFYERSDVGVWLATSRDLKTFVNVQDEPVMSPGPGEFEKDLIALNQIIKHQGRYYAYYHGSARSGPAKGLWSTCIATSTDLRRWEKYSGNPLQPTKQNKSSGIVVHDGKGFRLYTMHPVVNLHLPAR